jgi:3-methyl-2-oxobutanoate hydroxymethyltransferase
VFELMPSALSREIGEQLPIPIIGIGAGSGVAGQVLVLHDMLNVTTGKLPRFVRNFMEGSASVAQAVERYVTDVRARRFPDDKLHGY